MPRKTVLYILAFASSLLVLFWLGKDPWVAKEVKPDRAVFEELKDAKVTALNIEKKGADGFLVNLELKNGYWVFLEDGTYIRASQWRVRNILNKLQSARLVAVASPGKENFKKFSLDNLNGVSVEVFSGDRLLLALFVGTTAQDYSHCFIRKKGTDKVLTVNRNLTKDISKYTWKERKVVDVEPDSVTWVKYRYNMGRIFSLYKESGKWKRKGTSGKKLSPHSVKKLLNTLNNLPVYTFFTGASGHGLKKPRLGILFGYGDGLKDGIIVGDMKKGTNTYYVKRQSDGHVFLVASSFVSKLFYADDYFYADS